MAKAIDKAAGASREVIGQRDTFTGANKDTNWACSSPRLMDVTAPATPAAAEWQGWGTALKPAYEPVVCARKPLAGKTVAANVQTHGTGALNIDACRIDAGGEVQSRPAPKKSPGWRMGGDDKLPWSGSAAGRWPANVALDEHMAAVLDEQSGTTKGRVGMTQQSSARAILGAINSANPTGGQGQADEGGASRFFYVAKAPKRERPVVDGVAHPTVKPLALMRWLIRLVTPPGGVVLDPFEGSGTTLEACLLEGFAHVGIEREADYLPLILARLDRQAGTLPAAA